jgi:hypothetical protein
LKTIPNELRLSRYLNREDVMEGDPFTACPQKLPRR